MQEGMTMRGKWFSAGFMTVLGVLAWAVPSRAGDTIRLNRVDTDFWRPGLSYADRR
jgi:hypothetical protein